MGLNQGSFAQTESIFRLRTIKSWTTSRNRIGKRDVIPATSSVGLRPVAHAMNRLSFLIIVLTLLFVSNTVNGETASTPIGAYPVPAVEMRDRIVAWFEASGFQVLRGGVPPGNFVLECSKGKERYVVEIRPNSPLASFAQLASQTAGTDGNSVVAALKASLDNYVRKVQLQGLIASQKIPDSVFSYNSAVFCLSASAQGATVRCSGFAVDHKGLIVTTAHGLEGIRQMTVWSGNGEKYAGKIVKRDPSRDLTLIKVAKRLDAVVPVNRLRQTLKTGDTVFSLVCSESNGHSVRTGVVDEPPVVVNKQPLWQVDLSVAPGDSGSPVFDTEGMLAGVTKGRFRGDGSRGFVIPANTLRKFLGSGGR